MVNPILFYSLSALILLSAICVVLAKNPVYAVLSLVVSLFALSTLFIALEAYFVAVVQVLVYAGAILVLFLFVVMLIDLKPEPGSMSQNKGLKIAGIVFSVGLFLLIARATSNISPKIAAVAFEGNTAQVGEILFTKYALPFEIASVLLLVGIIGAIVLAKKKI